MTVTLDGTGGVLTRIGALYRWLEQIRLTAAGTGTAGRWPYELNDVYVKYEDAPNVVQAAIEDIQESQAGAVSSAEQLAAALQAAAEGTLIEMVDADDLLPERSVAEALRVLIEQMVAAAEDVQENAVSTTVTPGASNVGDGQLITDDLDALGQQLENALAEDILFERDPDSLISFDARGESPADSKLSANWPLGSGANATVAVTDAELDEGHVSNGSFNAFTTNTPDDWTIDVGAAGSEILEETTTKLVGTAALEMVGDGATLTQISQDIAANVTARTPFAVGFFAKVDVTPAAGVLTVDLYDGSSIIQDDAGNNQSFTVDLTALDTNWASFGGLFRIADPLPTNVYLRIRQSTALSSGSSLFIDQLVGIDAIELYPGGPYASIIIGATAMAEDDTFLVTVANDRASVYQEAFDVFFDMTGKRLILPVDSTPSITNSLPSYEGS